MEKIVRMMELKGDKVRDYIEIHKKENVWPEQDNDSATHNFFL